WGAGVFNVREGNMDDLDLSGILAGVKIHYPEIVSNGNWQLAFVIDDSATGEQSDALERIFSGKAGGAFADMAGLVTEFTLERAAVSYSDTGISMGATSFTYEPLRGADGEPT